MLLCKCVLKKHSDAASTKSLKKKIKKEKAREKALGQGALSKPTSPSRRLHHFQELNLMYLSSVPLKLTEVGEAYSVIIRYSGFV